MKVHNIPRYKSKFYNHRYFAWVFRTFEHWNKRHDSVNNANRENNKSQNETDWETWESASDDFEDTVDEEMIKLARRMKADGMTFEQITKYTGLTAEEIHSLSCNG